LWFITDSLNVGRSFGAAVTLGDTIHLVGGVRDSLSLFQLCPVQTLPPNAFWITGTFMPTLRASIALGAVRGRLYAAGGDLVGAHGISTGVSNKLEVYNPVNKTWSTGAQMPTSRSAAGAAVAGDRLYVLGGREQIAPGGQLGGAPGLATDRVEVYDVAAARWVTPSPTSLPRPRCGCGAATLGGRVYLVGGFGATSGLNAMDWVEAYDPATNTWSPRAPMPEGLADPAVTVLDGEVIVVGGVHRPGFANIDVYAYRPQLDILAPGASALSAAQTRNARPARRVRAAPP
jgi:N-acetylneuraminic acid mutarotase